MTPTMDHTAFPFVINRIVVFAPLASLLQLRRTSKAFRTRVDNLILSHVVLRNSVQDGLLALHVPHGLPDAGQPLPYLPNLVHTLDVDFGVRPIRGADRGPHGPFPALRTMRRFGPGITDGRIPSVNVPALPPTVIDYIDISAPDGYQCEQSNAVGARQRITRYEHFNALGARRHIIHVRWNELAMTPKRYLATTPGIEELVFVLWPEAAGGGDVAPDERLFLSLWASLIKQAISAASVQLTIVGLEHVNPNNVTLGNFEGPLSRPDLSAGQAAFQNGFVHELSRFDTVVPKADSVRFLTREEWWARLGEDKDVVGVWPAYSGCAG
ncbi:hypothetical protein Q8F55_000043 [Vanrija albida]|uniref:F-box domain-containing protein n=1 Tax=Vanrija albida TaxID=181172 RepID=A0ABR3QC52_9TREE